MIYVGRAENAPNIKNEVSKCAFSYTSMYFSHNYRNICCLLVPPKINRTKNTDSKKHGLFHPYISKYAFLSCFDLKYSKFSDYAPWYGTRI